MVKASVRWCILLTLGAAFLAGCTGDDDDKACVPNDQKACACLGGGQGIQVCQADGMAYSECQGCNGGSSSANPGSSGTTRSSSYGSGSTTSGIASASSSGAVVTSSSTANNTSATSGGSPTTCSGAPDPFCHANGIHSWTDPTTAVYRWAEAGPYCTGLGGRLPTISELRTLIRSCPATQTGGSCGITDQCANFGACYNDACNDCPSRWDGRYSVFGTYESAWSATETTDDPLTAYMVDFNQAHVGYGNKKYANSDDGDRFQLRCVR